jgi:ferrochelatase
MTAEATPEVQPGPAPENAHTSAPGTFDAVLVLSFGGPEKPDDVMPFLRNVVSGRNVPDERLAEVATQYDRFGGVSPINEQNRTLIAALEAELGSADIDLPIYWGNRNWHPFLDATVQEMADDGVRSALVYVTSAFGSYSGCRQYRENLAAASEKVVGQAPFLQKLRLFYNHPGFVDPVTEQVEEALRRHRADHPDAGPPRVVFTAHSIPVSMAESCDYQAQLLEVADIVAGRFPRAAGDSAADSGRLEIAGHDLVFQSRSGPPQIPWLEPDVGDHIEALSAQGTNDLIVVPLGFVSDHMEVLFDLDTQAAEIAADLGVRMTRAATVGVHPRFVTMIRELIAEQLHGAPKLWVGNSGPWPDWCPEGHCLPAQRPKRV